MKRYIVPLYLTLLTAISLSSAARADEVTHKNATYEDTKFYTTLSDNEKSALKHLVDYHHDGELSMAVQAISAFEKMLATCTQEERRADLAEKLSFLGKKIHEKVRGTMETRATHGAFFTQILNCCTPRDAYFREVVTEILTVTGDVNIAGDTIITGNEAITGNLLVGGTLTVTGSTTFNTAVGAAAGTVATPSYHFIASPSTGLYSPGANRFALSANGANKINYDGQSVLVTSTYRFSALRSTDQVLPAATTTTIVFDSAVIGSPNYNTGTGVYTAPTTGIYLVTFNVSLFSDQSDDFTFVYAAKNDLAGNGIIVNVAFSSSIGVVSSGTGSGILSLNAGDTVKVGCTGSSLAGVVTVLGGLSNSLFTVHLLSV